VVALVSSEDISEEALRLLVVSKGLAAVNRSRGFVSLVYWNSTKREANRLTQSIDGAGQRTDLLLEALHFTSRRICVYKLGNLRLDLSFEFILECLCVNGGFAGCTGEKIGGLSLKIFESCGDVLVTRHDF
jgi:hypothetical protein